ncbi:enolase, putative [Bodo saltans]|uniref:phosphopyruvate hydratase n=1 Tax=Bodo saltans TaxID=75058 RepID=A0A0S4IQJ6_BODSA|nr:enolase, putative [Bodo saltans]|eukprot:CUF20113.1 enolase, putative [Bodo saltans]
MSSSALHHLSWDAYCEHVHLSKVLTEGANACYAAKSSKPEAFLAQYFKSSVAADVIESLEAVEVPDGHGGYTLAFSLKLASGKVVERTMGTSPVLALHPGTARKLTFSTLSRAATPLLTAPSPVNPKDPQANKPKPIIPAQRYEASARIVNATVAASLLGKSVVDQSTCDEVIATADGTSTLSTILAPTAAALSISVAQAAASILQTPLYRYLGSLNGVTRPVVPGVPPHLASAAMFLPRPIVTIFSTEPRHMGKVRVREVCLIPLHNGLTTSTATATVQANLTGEQQQQGSPTTTDPYTPLVSSPTCTQCGAFAAFSPRLVQQLQAVYDYLIQKLDDPPTNPDGSIKFNSYETLIHVVELVEEAVRESQSGATIGVDFQIGLVVDAALCFRTETAKYSFVEGTEYSGAQLAEALAQLCRDKKIAYIEDTHHENDHAEMRRLMHRVGSTTVIASQHVFGGDLTAIATHAPQMLVNHMMMRLSDHGTLTHAVRCASTFRAAYPGATIGIIGDSNESSATSSSATIDVAVALGARFVRIGGLLRSEHAALLSRLFEVQRSLERENLLIPPPLWESCHLELPPAPLEPVAEVNAKDAKKKK